jgi:hypothetical protein
MYDRRFYHVILVEDQNYKVTIYNYNNKVTKFTQLDNKYSIIQENDFDYNFFTYDYKSSVMSGKKISSILSEKNENWWSKYDLQLNDLQKNIKSFKFNNEINLLLYDKCGVKLKKSKTNSRPHTSQMKPLSDRSPVLTYTSMKSTELPVSPINTSSVILKKLAVSPNIHNHDPDEAYIDRVKGLMKFIDTYLSKYPSSKAAKLGDIVEHINEFNIYKSILADKNKNLYHSVYIRQLSDWMLILFTKFFNDVNSVYLSIRWLSCNSIPIHNFMRELSKKARSANLSMARVPCDDIILSVFKNICFWEIEGTAIQEVDRLLRENILLNFLRTEYGNNFIYFCEDYNVMIKLHEYDNNKILIYILDNVDESPDYFGHSYFVEYAKKIEEILKVFHRVGVDML